jgi:hypothetical protein
MEVSIAVALALVLCMALWVPFFIMNIRGGKARGHNWFICWKPRGHPDIGPDVGFRHTRPGADDARGAQY